MKEEGDTIILHVDENDFGHTISIYNIGNNKPIQLMDYIHAVEKVLGKKAILNLMPMQPGDVVSTYADISKLQDDLGYKPTTSVQEGVKYFIDWYLAYTTTS